MKTWKEYKNYVKAIDENSKHAIEEIEALTEIVSSVIKNVLNLE